MSSPQKMCDPAIDRFETVADIRQFSRAAKQNGQRIALVPTMGCLHDGHLSLVRQGLESADKVITSIYVNPRQFGVNEDLDAYPRQVEADIKMLADIGCHAVYCPQDDEMYPHGYATNINVAGISEGLCGHDRPGHFDGVATVVTKLLIQCEPDIAIFGEKDYQQLALIKRMVTDLNIDCDIKGGNIIRDDHGLALSSRNKYLSKDQLAIARQFNVILKQACDAIEGGDDVPSAIDTAWAALLNAGVEKVDYLELRAADNLKPLTHANRPARLISAIRLGQARLLDNMAVKPVS